MVTVIVPAYNAEKTIQNCINSIQKQSYKDIEIVVIDDGSTDRTKEIVQRLLRKDGRIKIISQYNQGASAARNKGIEKASGEYVTFVDADDEIEPQLIKVLITYLKKYNADYVKTSVIRINKNGQKARFDEKQKIICTSVQEWNEHFFDLMNHGLNSPVGKLYKKSILTKSNVRFNLELVLSEDLIFNLDYLEHVNRLVFLPEAYYKYYIGNSELTVKYRSNLFDCRKKAIELYSDFLKRNQINRDIVPFLYIKLMFSEAIGEVTHGTTKKDRLKKIRKNLKKEEIIKSVNECKATGIMQKILFGMAKTQNAKVIDAGSRIFAFLQNKKWLINFRKVSV